MIDVTLRFATLELAITALAAVRQATGSETPAPKTEVKDSPKPDAKPKKAAAETPPTAASTPAAASPTPPTESPSPGTSSGATKEQVSEAITAAVKTDRQKVVDTLTSFGAKSGKDLKAEQYAEFLAKLAEAVKPDDLAG